MAIVIVCGLAFLGICIFVQWRIVVNDFFGVMVYRGMMCERTRKLTLSGWASFILEDILFFAVGAGIGFLICLFAGTLFFPEEKAAIEGDSPALEAGYYPIVEKDKAGRRTEEASRLIGEKHAKQGQISALFQKGERFYYLAVDFRSQRW